MASAGAKRDGHQEPQASVGQGRPFPADRPCFQHAASPGDTVPQSHVSFGFGCLGVLPCVLLRLLRDRALCRSRLPVLRADLVHPLCMPTADAEVTVPAMQNTKTCATVHGKATPSGPSARARIRRLAVDRWPERSLLPLPAWFSHCQGRRSIGPLPLLRR